MSISKTIQLLDGTELPALGQGTWWMGEQLVKHDQEIDTLRRGIELGMNVIDTAEMYGEGRSESLVGEAITDCREQVFLISKVLPNNASSELLGKSLEESLKRLQTDYIDLYLLHWRGGVPLQETVDEMESFRQQGVIKRWGVSNFDLCDMEELMQCTGSEYCQSNQVLYHLGSRGIEFDLKPWLLERSMPLIAYSPLAQAGRLRETLLANQILRQIADELDADPFQVMLAWCIRDGQTLAVPKASQIAHVEHNAKAATLSFTDEQLARLDNVFRPPLHKMPLDII